MPQLPPGDARAGGASDRTAGHHHPLLRGSSSSPRYARYAQHARETEEIAEWLSSLLSFADDDDGTDLCAHSDDATVAHPDGSRGGRWPPAPFGNPARGYDVPPPPQQQRGRRLLHRAGGRSGAGAGRDE